MREPNPLFKLAVGAAITFALFQWVFAGSDGLVGGRSGPEPGSPAAQYCDTTERFFTNDDGELEATLRYDGVRYDSECLVTYPWEAK